MGGWGANLKSVLAPLLFTRQLITGQANILTTINFYCITLSQLDNTTTLFDLPMKQGSK